MSQIRIINDVNTGSPLIKCVLPDDFEAGAQLQLKQYPNNTVAYLSMQATRGNCTIGCNSGEGYVCEKKKVSSLFGFRKQQAQSDSGAWYADFTSIKDDLDSTAASIFSKKVDAVTYYDLSDTIRNRAQEALQKQINNLCEELQLGASISPMPIGNVISNYLLDGGMGVYEDEGKTVAVCFYRIGIECDIIQGQGITENITGEPFSKATPHPMAIASTAAWSIPYIMYMITDNKEDLGIFMNFADSFGTTPELQAYCEQLRQQVNQMQYQKAQQHTMETQAAINNMWAQHNARWAATERMSRQMSQDMDRFRSNLNAQMAENDMRFNTGPSYGESTDDRIQRWRHEAMMGVDTYERNDGSTVEYSTYADRVFENNLDSTTHFGTHNYFDDYVPDGWHELNKKK
ncbi:MAG: hypothetical protein IKX97_04570 [Erysipelotrichaceae bacterium]|nr:hypothetical protein [Erysipelotrichaceae bacterium]